MEEIEDLIQQGRELMAAARFEDAAKVFEKALSIDKKNAQAYIHLGNAQMNIDKTNEAIANFKKAAMFEETAKEANYSLGCAEFIKGDLETAIKQFNKCEEMGMQSLDMYGIMSVIFMEAGDTVQAIRCINRGIKLEPLNPQPRLDKAQIYMTQGKNKEAINVLRETEDLLPDVGDTYIIEAELFSNMDENDNAIKTIERAISRFPQDPNLQISYARILNSAGRYSDALNAINKYSEFSNGVLVKDAVLQKSVAYAGLEDLDNSISTLKDACDSELKDQDLLYILMSECISEKKYSDAKDAANSILLFEDVNPRYKAAALYNQIICDKELGATEDIKPRLEDLAKVLRKITISNPGLMDVYVFRLLTYKELEQYDKAYEIADHLLAVMPKSPTGYAFKAEIAKAQGDESACIAYKQKALEIDPTFKF